MLPCREEFLSYLSLEKGFKKQSLVSARSHFSLLKNWVGEGDLTLQNCRDFIFFKQQQGCSNNYLRRMVITFRHLCAFLKLDWGGQIPLPRFERTEIKIVKLEIVQKLLAYPHKTIYLLFFEFLILTGCRRSEAINLKVSDLTDGIIHFRETKTGDDRYFPLPPHLLEKIEEIIKTKNPDDHIFTNRRYNRPLSPNSIKETLNLYTTKLGLPHLHPHLFRHLFATEMLRANPPGGVSVISRLLGHHNPVQTLNTYQHLVMDDLKKAIMYHPLVRQKRNPYEILEAIKNDLRNYKLDEDKRFFYEITEGNEGIRINVFIR